MGLLAPYFHEMNMVSQTPPHNVSSFMPSNSHTPKTGQMDFQEICDEIRWYIYAVEYYSAIKMNKPLIYMTWVSLTKIILSRKKIHCRKVMGQRIAFL